MPTLNDLSRRLPLYAVALSIIGILAVILIVGRGHGSDAKKASPSRPATPQRFARNAGLSALIKTIESDAGRRILVGALKLVRNRL